MRKSSLTSALAAVIVIGAFGATAANAEDTQFVPLPTYRVGPYASSGAPWFAGELDYFKYINEVEGGVNGVKLDVQEFETEYSPDRAVEVYERVKDGVNGSSPMAFFITHSTPATYALGPRARQDKIPLIDPAGGRPESLNGLVFEYEFPLLFTYYSQGSVAINYIAQQMGGFENLKGKKIVTVYHDSGYGRSSQPVMTVLAAKYGFEDIQIPVAHPGSEQSAIWRQVRGIQPDFVVLRTWGVGTPVAIKTAKRFGIDISKMIGDVWASSETDLIPAEDAAVGYCGLAPYPAGTDFVIHKRLQEKILDTGMSDLQDKSTFGTVYYNIGMVNAALSVEGMRTAMQKFGNRPLTGDEMRWGLENMKIDGKRLEEMGMTGLLQELHVSAADHEGGGAARIQCWDGKKFNLVTDWIAGDAEVIKPLVAEVSAKFAAENGITPRDLSSE
ncbi:ABC transporter permease [Pseudaminobacter arsenicus]|uniref:ABC transporter permease n=1 Tax=Borborobacter arsenicus TaxID=1851146 RepID=A0A432VCQ2_9HYPH|nr:ABC transporter permease [Pseudaminobacter arsenicus]